MDSLKMNKEALLMGFSKSAAWFASYEEKPLRQLVALHSGTSANGVDAAIIQISGSGETARAKLVHHLTWDYPEAIRQKLFEIFDPRTATVGKVCQANFLLGNIMADAVDAVVKAGGLEMEQIDAVASSGQIVYHVRKDQDDRDVWIGENVIPSALDLGEGTVISERTGRTCVTNMRSRDMAVGGEGNPLVTYGDWVLFRHPEKTRAIQNIGGIANPTILPAGKGIDEVQAFDTGPGNMVIDGVLTRLTHGEVKYDQDGLIAAAGEINRDFLNELMEHPYIRRCPPKATGREVFGDEFIEKVIDRSKQLELSLNDLVATVTAFSAESIAYNYHNFVFPGYRVDEVLLCGGGAHNHTLVKLLGELLHPIPIKTVAICDVPVDAREVTCVGIIANETLLGQPGNVPNSTGGRKRVIMGQITLGND
jgi:anhydro-N-acetylmuramic acid kinase